MKIVEITAHLALMLLVVSVCTGFTEPAHASARLLLHDGWTLQSSSKVQANGESISTTGYAAVGWYKATVPSTVVGILIENKVYPEPFFGMNLRSIPGMDYPIGVNFSNRPMPADSPFKVPWWYRKEFKVAPRPSGQVWLNFDGINFRANIWLNGKRIADAKQVAGAYRMFEFNITDALSPDKPNVLAVEIFPPEVNDLAITWVDWNPTPPDKDMGLWRDVCVTTTGPVALRYPHILTRLDLPSTDKAHLTVSAELRNASAKQVKATLKGRIEKIEFHQTVDLAARETKQVTFMPDKFGQLNIIHPRLWWPTLVGPQNLYDLSLQVDVDGKVSDQESIRFGIRESTSELSDKNYRIFKINGKPILIRGGGWAPDLFLRPSAKREIAEIRYVKDMNLNTIRFEGKMESRRFLELCDREGILVIAGWSCCDHWEKPEKWDEEDYSISAASLRDQLLRLRNHPSVFTWWNGSDRPPDERTEKKYLEIVKETKWPGPVLSSATAKPSIVSETTGVRMTGPYEYVPPVYWYVDTQNGGAYSFNTETSPGPAIPPVESLRRMLPQDHLWPIDDVWNFHAGGGAFKNIKIFTEALNERFGAATSNGDYVKKAELMAYDGQRAMFEAYGRNKYTSTGVIQWMMNNAWPSLIWHLYDYYLRPAGGYFGTKKACEPLHIQYSYDDGSVVVVNSYYQEFKSLKATARVYNLDMTEKHSQQAAVHAAPDSSLRVLTIPKIQGLTSTYFVKLILEDPAGKQVSSNFYSLSTKPETLNEAESTWYYTPTRTFADFTALGNLPPVDLKVSAKRERRGTEEGMRVTVENPGKALAFFIQMKVTKGSGGEEVLPVMWQDNYFSLLPGEKREITATYGANQIQGKSAVVEVHGWNVIPKALPAANKKEKQMEDTRAQGRVTKFIRYSRGGAIAYGILENETVLQLDCNFLAGGKPTGEKVRLAEIRLLAPVEPSKIVAVGLNYKSHLGDRPAPAYPGLFSKLPTTIIGPEESILIPPGAEDVHYEGEMVVVIGEKTKSVSEVEARGHIFGITAGNDVSERIWQKEDLQWFRAKGSDTFGPLGPAVVQGLNYDDLRLTTRLNGEVRQSQRTSDLIFPVAKIVSYVSQYVTLLPGDLIFTGTPGTTKPMKPGDVVEVEIEGVGVLRNAVEAK